MSDAKEKQPVETGHTTPKEIKVEKPPAPKKVKIKSVGAGFALIEDGSRVTCPQNVQPEEGQEIEVRFAHNRWYWAPPAPKKQ